MNHYRLDKTKRNNMVRYELLQNGHVVFTFDACELEELKDVFSFAEAMLWAEQHLPTFADIQGGEL